MLRKLEILKSVPARNDWNNWCCRSQS